jgi:hypothetical protein
MRFSSVLFWFCLILFAVFSPNAHAQSYYWLQDRGVTDDYPMSPSGTVIMTAPMNDVFSPPQTIPFTWKFYGRDVTQYKVSDNGYITFDLAAAASVPGNTAIPAAAEPNDAIYAFWDNLELSNNPTFVTNTVKTYTVGAAPNRVHVIHWNVAPLGRLANGNYLYFALRLYEQGDFDVIFQQIRLDAGVTVSATVGCENADGTDATMAAGSPNYTYTGGAYIKENVRVVKFIYGTRISRDVMLKSLDLPRTIGITESWPIRAEVINNASDTVTSVGINCLTGAGGIEYHLIDGLSIPTNASQDIGIMTNWSPWGGQGQFHKVRVWISAVNGQPDQKPDDDTLEQSVFVNLGAAAAKKTLIEEYSTTPCGYCPDGHMVLENILAKHPDVIGMTHHTGYKTDSMTISESVTYDDAFGMGAPMATIDRILWPNTTRHVISRNDWERRALEALARKAPVSVVVSATLVPETRLLRVATHIQFVDYPYPGDLRLTVFVIEDHVTGSGNGYDQTNYYNDTPGHPLYQKGDPIVGYDHRHVIRAVLPQGKPWGDDQLIPSTVQPVQSYLANYEWTVPTRFKEANMSVIAFVSYHDGTNNEILNAEETAIIVTGLDRSDQALPGGIAVFPSPVASDGILELVLNDPGTVRASIVDALGREVAVLIDADLPAGRHERVIDVRQLPAGMYMAVVRNREGVRTAKMIVMR